MTKKDIVVMPKIIYNLDKQTFFNYYFKTRSKDDIAAFIAPYFLNMVNKDVNFSLADLLGNIKTVPSYLLKDYPTGGKPNLEIDVSYVKLV